MLVNRCGSSGDPNEILKYYSLISGVVFNDVYAASKFAMEGFCECLAVQLLKFNVTWVSLTHLAMFSKKNVFIFILYVYFVGDGPIKTYD